MKVCIYVSPIDNNGPKFPEPEKYYKAAYEDLFDRINKLGSETVLLHSAEDTYKGNGKFLSYWKVLIGKNGPRYEKVDEEIIVDFLYDKGRFPYTDIKILNHPTLRDICADKYQSYLFASDYHSKTFFVRDKNDLDALLLGWGNKEEKRIAIKELDANGGSKVFVGDVQDYDNSLEYPLIAQEFIDTSKGYVDLVDGIHDVRIAVYNGEPIHGRLRVPGDGGLKSNIQYGGLSRALYPSEIPDEVVNRVKEIDQSLEKFGERYYSADFGFDGTEWKLFELNAFPGLMTVDADGEAAADSMQRLAEKLIVSTKEAKNATK